MSDNREREKVVLLTHKDVYGFVWEYFKLHAGQRMSLLKFYISLCSLLVGALAATFEPGFDAPTVGCALGLLLVVVSFTFWSLDRRTSRLNHVAEETLANLEEAFPRVGGAAGAQRLELIRLERSRTASAAQSASWPQLFQLSYSKSLGLMFFVFALVGLAGASAALILGTS